MSMSATVSVLVLIGINWATQLVLAENTTLQSQVKFVSKRQLKDDLCFIPNQLENGEYFAHKNRCPAGDNSAACRLVPGTPVNVAWVIRYRCSLGYQLNTTRIASICLKKKGAPARWLPRLPSCIESAYTSRNIPKKDSCGLPARYLRQQRAVDGKISQRGAWPWMVIFGQNRTHGEGLHWFCAGTLVSRRHILTAANCVAKDRKRPIFIARFDGLNLNEARAGGAHPTDITIQRTVITHPWFHQDAVFENNIAVVILKTELPISDFIRPICLPTPDFKDRNFAGKRGYFVSWGQTDDDRDLNHKRPKHRDLILHELNAKIIDNDVCNKNYRSYQSSDTPIIISNKLICAALDTNRSCQGDIGSPLMIKSKGRYFLMGIVATKSRCYDDLYPRLFTNLAMYMDWIIANLQI